MASTVDFTTGGTAAGGSGGGRRPLIPGGIGDYTDEVHNYRVQSARDEHKKIKIELVMAVSYISTTTCVCE
jgi:hypothetical protein